jgi:hypothetical protein
MNRFKRNLKWIAIATGATIALLLVLNAYFIWNTGTRLERRLTELRQAGDPVQIADFARAPVPPEKNADVYLRRATSDLDAIQKELMVWYPKSVYPTGTLSAPEKERLEKLFAAYSQVMPLLEQAADSPDYDPQLDYTLSPTGFLEPCMQHSSEHRVLYRVLRARCALLLAQGHNDEALATQLLMLRLTRHWRREPFLLNYLVTAVCEHLAMGGLNQVLQTGPVSSSARQALDAELALHDTIEGYRWALRNERAYSLSSFREMPGDGFWLTRGFANDLMLRLIHLFDRYLEKASRLYADAIADKSHVSMPGGVPNVYGALVTLLEPALVSAREPSERVRALSRSLRVLNALQARAPRDDNSVPNIGDLGLPTEATIDPFNGKSLIVKKAPEGWTVYSVGSDLVDNGGKLDGRTDVGAGPNSAAN